MNSRDKLYGPMAGSTPVSGACSSLSGGRTKADYRGSEALKSCHSRISSKSFGATFFYVGFGEGYRPRCRRNSFSLTLRVIRETFIDFGGSGADSGARSGISAAEGVSASG